MTLVGLVSRESVAVEDLAMVESGLAQYGTLLATWQAILNRPGLFSAYLPFLRAVASPGVVDIEIKDLSALLVGHLNHCHYTVSHRYASAKRNGIADDVIRKVVHRDWEGLDADLRLALELTVRLTQDPPDVTFAVEPRVVPADILAEWANRFSDEATVELVMSISVWNALARFHRVMGFELDMPAPPVDVVPE